MCYATVDVISQNLALSCSECDPVSSRCIAASGIIFCWFVPMRKRGRANVREMMRMRAICEILTRPRHALDR